MRLASALPVEMDRHRTVVTTMYVVLFHLFTATFCCCLACCIMTTCLENLEMSGNLTAVREMSGILLKISEMSGKNVVMEKWPKTVYCKLHICIHTGI